MEFTFKTIVVVLIFLIAALVVGSIILGWTAEANSWIHDIVTPIKESVSG